MKILNWFSAFLFLTASSVFAETFRAGPDYPGGLLGVRDAVREMAKTGSVDVILESGVWRVGDEPLVLTQEDSGTPESPVRWHGMGETTVISGGTAVSPELFRPVTDPELLKRLDDAAKASILQIDLSEAGIKPLPAIGNRAAAPLAIPELFFGAKRMKIAVWPNDGWALVKNILDGGTSDNNGTVSEAAGISERKTEPPRGGTFEYDAVDENRPARWVNTPSVLLHGYWCFDWCSEVIRTSRIDSALNQISLADKHTYGLRQGNPSPRRWMAVNLLEEIDLPGEYAYDAESNRLWFYPPAPIDSETIIVAAADRPMVLFEGASNMVFSDMTVTDNYANGIEVKNGDHIRLERLALRNTRMCGITINGGKEHSIADSLIEETGNGGISLSGGDFKTLEPGGFLIENNVIRRFSIHRLCYSSAISLSGVGHIVRHNELYDAPHMAVALGTNDTVFEYNTIHHVCMTGDDCGALYKGRNPARRGNVIRYNFWYDIGTPRGHGCAAIYFDDGDGGDSVIGNLFVRCGDPGAGSFGTVFSHGGHGILAEGNVFVDCKRPFGSAPWEDQRWKDMLDSPLWQKRLLDEVDITSSVYTEHYPELIGFMDGAPAEQRRSTARNNIFIRPAEETTGNWDIDETNRVQE